MATTNNNSLNSVSQVQQMLNEQAAANNAWSAEQAQKQMDFQLMMSNTAHQREMEDLKKAGLNPVLAANNGASTTSGAMANPDQSQNNALVNFMANLMQTQNQLEIQRNNADLQRELTEKNNSLTAMIAELNRQVSLQTSLQAADATKAAAGMSAAAIEYQAQMNNESAHYTADEQTHRQEVADKNALTRLMVQGAIDETLNNGKYAFEEYMATEHPSTLYQYLMTGVDKVGDLVFGDQGGFSANKEVTNAVLNTLQQGGLTSGSQTRNMKRLNHNSKYSWIN